MKEQTIKTVQAKSDKNRSVQLLRGVAIIAVVLIHSATPDLVRVILRPFLNFAVALFIFLSGYLTKLEIGNVGRFYQKRILKVLVPYLIWSVIYAVPSGFENFFAKLLTGRYCIAYYYIFVYIQFVLLTPLICRLIQSKFRWIGWLITPIGTLVFRYIFKFLNIPLLSANYHYLFMAWFIYYYLGLLLGNGIGRRAPKMNKCILLYVAAIGVSLAEGFLWYRLNDMDMAATQLRLTSILTSVTFLLLCYHIIQREDERVLNSLWLKPLLLLGDCSFGIYLSHMLIRIVLGKLVSSIMFLPIDTLLMLSISCLCVILGKKLLGKYSWLLGL